MNAQEFAYWLQGFFELREAGGGADKPLTVEQAKMIQEHLQLVFTKVTGEKKTFSPEDWKDLFEKVQPAQPVQVPYPYTEPYRPDTTWPYRPFEIICSNNTKFCGPVQ